MDSLDKEMIQVLGRAEWNALDLIMLLGTQYNLKLISFFFFS